MRWFVDEDLPSTPVRCSLFVVQEWLCHGQALGDASLAEAIFDEVLLRNSEHDDDESAVDSLSKGPLSEEGEQRLVDSDDDGGNGDYRGVGRGPELEEENLPESGNVSSDDDLCHGQQDGVTRRGGVTECAGATRRGGARGHGKTRGRSRARGRGGG